MWVSVAQNEKRREIVFIFGLGRDISHYPPFIIRTKCRSTYSAPATWYTHTEKLNACVCVTHTHTPHTSNACYCGYSMYVNWTDYRMHVLGVSFWPSAMPLSGCQRLSFLVYFILHSHCLPLSPPYRRSRARSLDQHGYRGWDYATIFQCVCVCVPWTSLLSVSYMPPAACHFPFVPKTANECIIIGK